MKKVFGKISLLIILIGCIYTGVSMGKMDSTYDGIGDVIVNETVKETGAVNTVTAIVFGFRGYDTLGESFVLFTAICGATAVLRKVKKKGGEAK